MSSDELADLAARLTALLDRDPAEAVRQARAIDVSGSGGSKAKCLRAAILVDGGAACAQLDAIEEGLALYRGVHAVHPTGTVGYNLANAIASVVRRSRDGRVWLDHQESTREQRAEARRLYWAAAHDQSAPREVQTQAWTNLAGQLTDVYRFGEAHDARLAALAIDPANGVAAGCAARDLLWLWERGVGSDLTRIEAAMLAKIAKANGDRIREYAGDDAAQKLAALADELGEPPERARHTDPFIGWVEHERLTLSPVVELVAPAIGKLDWLMLPSIREREPAPSATKPPPVFAMFNVLKADFIVARDLAWRAKDERGWPTTGRFADTVDHAAYGPDVSALVLAHRTALDLLDKVAVTANHYFEIGQVPARVSFGKLWRNHDAKKAEAMLLRPRVEAVIQNGAPALYGLVELADDYHLEGEILHSQKKLRNAGTHRFVVLHDLGDPTEALQATEVERHLRDDFSVEVVRALRTARSALQMLAIAISQCEAAMKQKTSGAVASLFVADHDRVGGSDP